MRNKGFEKHLAWAHAALDAAPDLDYTEEANERREGYLKAATLEALLAEQYVKLAQLKSIAEKF